MPVRGIKEYKLICPVCRSKFKSPFLPRADTPLSCGTCTVAQTDMRTHFIGKKYTQQLLIFLGNNLSGVASIDKLDSGYYRISLNKKGEKLKQICTLTWMPLYGKNLLPHPLTALKVLIIANDSLTGKPLTLFIKTHRFENIVTEVVLK